MQLTQKVVRVAVHKCNKQTRINFCVGFWVYSDIVNQINSSVFVTGKNKGCKTVNIIVVRPGFPILHFYFHTLKPVRENNCSYRNIVFRSKLFCFENKTCNLVLAILCPGIPLRCSVFDINRVNIHCRFEFVSCIFGITPVGKVVTCKFCTDALRVSYVIKVDAVRLVFCNDFFKQSQKVSLYLWICRINKISVMLW